MTSSIDYLERRVAVLKLEQPRTKAGRDALAHTIHELNNCILALKLAAVKELDRAIAEAQQTPEVH